MNNAVDAPLITAGPWLTGILEELRSLGAKGYIVGGAVRDALMGRTPSDIDVEVYGVSYERLEGILRQHGEVDVVGKEFGVIKYRSKDGDEHYDFSIPRRENKNGVKHQDFLVTFDPDITPQEASERRDFTINAMLYDPLAGELLDFHHGAMDLTFLFLSPVSEAFKEDPLRVLRAFQFASRTGLDATTTLAQYGMELVDQYDTISRERICGEWMKWATLGTDYPNSFYVLEQVGWLTLYPELGALQYIQQDKRWHPEGDALTHTGLVCDAAARIAEREGLEGDDRAVLIFAALCHDLGKAVTTKAIALEKSGVKVTHYGHEKAGGPLARRLLERIGVKEAIIARVVPLVEHHLAHLSAKYGASVKMVRKLADSLKPATIEELCWLMEADCKGRDVEEPGPEPGIENILATARNENAMKGPQKPLIQGRHLLERGVPPSPLVGGWLAYARESQKDGRFSTEEEAMAWLDAELKASPAPPTFTCTACGGTFSTLKATRPNGDGTAVCEWCNEAEYEELLRELHAAMMKNGGGGGDEADVIRDRMELPGEWLSREANERMNHLSVWLYDRDGKGIRGQWEGAE